MKITTYFYSFMIHNEPMIKNISVFLCNWHHDGIHLHLQYFYVVIFNFRQFLRKLHCTKLANQKSVCGPTLTNLLFFIIFNVNNTRARYAFFLTKILQKKTLRNSKKTLKNFLGWRFAIPMTLCYNIQNKDRKGVLFETVLYSKKKYNDPSF
jgi:hypothetical protein